MGAVGMQKSSKETNVGFLCPVCTAEGSAVRKGLLSEPHLSPAERVLTASSLCLPRPCSP